MKTRTTFFTCKKCGWVGFVMDGGKYSFSSPWKCFRCGNSDKTQFRPSMKDDAPRGVTIQQINPTETSNEN